MDELEALLKGVANSGIISFSGKSTSTGSAEAVARPTLLPKPTFVYFEWNDTTKKWYPTTATTMPTPDNLPNGNFDGQLIEVEEKVA